MSTFFLEPDGDLVISKSGGIEMASDWDEIRQRLYRRCLTNPQSINFDGSIVPAGYIFHPDYGLGLPQLVYANKSSSFFSDLKQKIRQAILEDLDTDSETEPEIIVDTRRKKFALVTARFKLKGGQPKSIFFKVS